MDRATDRDTGPDTDRSTGSDRIYLDHASGSPLRRAARAAIADLLERGAALGDPSRSHAEGLESRQRLEHARAQCAAAFGARPREVILCSGATEAIAAAAFGGAGRGRHSVLSAVEHSAVRQWAQRGPHTVVPVDETGQVDPERVLSEVSAETGIVHLQWANHEVGTVQPITEVIAGCRARGVLVHIDAAQAAATVPIHFDALGADLLSVSGHKLGAPAGTGALLIRRGLRLDPLLVGGDQERARRAGAENLLGFIGFGAAANELSAELPTIGERLAEFTAQIIRWVTNRPGIEVLGHPADRLPHLVCLATDRIEPQPLLIALDRAGIAVHSGNSCSSEALEPSPVLAAMGVDAHRSLRVSVGWSTRQSDIDRLLIELPAALDALASLRRASDS